MSDKLIRIITLCEHGWTVDHCRFGLPHQSWDCRARCDGGSVVDLTRQEAIEVIAVTVITEMATTRQHGKIAHYAVDALLAGGKE